jgi:hypothetical protein
LAEDNEEARSEVAWQICQIWQEGVKKAGAMKLSRGTDD